MTVQTSRKRPPCRSAKRTHITNPPETQISPRKYFRYKRWLDIPVAAILLIPALPVIGVLVALIRITSPGPAIFRQRRVGLNGREFCLLKLRSMRIDAEAATGAVWATTNDPRTTRLGCVLRKLHLDELPQLFNVLKGEMTLVGPRPERPEFVAVLRKALPDYERRLSVPPGITGLAQVNLPPDTDLASVQRKLYLDLNYVQTAGLLLDLRLILATSTRIVKISTVRMLGLRRCVPELPVPSGRILAPSPEPVAESGKATLKASPRRYNGKAVNEVGTEMASLPTPPTNSTPRTLPR